MRGRGIFFAVLAAALYALAAPLSKLLLGALPPALTAGLLYLGAGAGMALFALGRRVARGPRPWERFTARELPFAVGMILLDIAAPLCLLFGLKTTSAASASLLNNFEIVATAIIALALFREKISPRLWAGILFVTASCALLSAEDFSALSFSSGALLILLACVFWGIENNCTRRLSGKDPCAIVVLKGLCSGAGSVAIGLCIGERASDPVPVLAAMAVGFVAYGLSIFFYVHAQRILGAARTGAYYAVAPFLGVFLSFAIFREIPNALFFAALALMAAGAWLSASDAPLFPRKSPFVRLSGAGEKEGNEGADAPASAEKEGRKEGEQEKGSAHGEDKTF